MIVLFFLIYHYIQNIFLMSICLNLNNSDQVPMAFYFMHKILYIFMHKNITNLLCLCIHVFELLH